MGSTHRDQNNAIDIYISLNSQADRQTVATSKISQCFSLFFTLNKNHLYKCDVALLFVIFVQFCFVSNFSSCLFYISIEPSQLVHLFVIWMLNSTFFCRSYYSYVNWYTISIRFLWFLCDFCCIWITFCEVKTSMRKTKKKKHESSVQMKWNDFYRVCITVSISANISIDSMQTSNKNRCFFL